jgi:hypothetical protein
MEEDNGNSGTFWNDTRIYLLGTRVSWVAVLWGNMLWIRKDFHLAKHHLVGCPTGRRPK